MQAVDTLGNQLVRDCEYIRMEARRVQEIEMCEMDPQVQADKLRKHHPDIRDQITQLNTIGALPHFGGSQPPPPRRSGMPYEAKRTAYMVKNLERCVKVCKKRHLPGEAVNSKCDIYLQNP